MADLLARSARPGSSTPDDRPPGTPSLAGPLAALTAGAQGMLVVMVPVLVAWATAADSKASVDQAVDTALQTWLVAHHAELAVPGGSVALVPLGLALLPVWLLFAAAARAARATRAVTPRAVATLTSGLASAYAVMAVLVALVARNDDVRPLPVSAFLGAGAIALVAGGAGALRGSGRALVLWLRLPVFARRALVGALGATATVLAAGAVLVGASVAVHHGTVTDLARGLDTGLPGGILVLLLGVLFVPTAAVWGAAFLVGPGFSVGVGTSVAVSGTHLGAVPAFPLLGALPADGGSGGNWLVALAVPLAAGVVAGLLVARRGRGAGPWRLMVGLGAAAGALAGVALGVLALAASGAAGPGRLTDVGPDPRWVALAFAAEVAVGAIVTLCAHRAVDMLRHTS